MKIIKIHTPDIFINTNKIEFLMEKIHKEDNNYKGKEKVMKAKKIMTNQKFTNENQKKKKIIFKCFNSIKSKVKDHKKQKENKFKKIKIQKDKVKFKKKIKYQSINNAKIK